MNTGFFREHMTLKSLSIPGHHSQRSVYCIYECDGIHKYNSSMGIVDSSIITPLPMLGTTTLFTYSKIEILHVKTILADVARKA